MPLPNDTVAWERPLDPSEILAYKMKFANALTGGEVIDIDQVTLTMSAEAVALGVGISTDADREPYLADGDTSIVLWPVVDEAFWSNAAFDGDGTTVGINAHFRTNSDPYQEIEKTFALTVRQR